METRKKKRFLDRLTKKNIIGKGKQGTVYNSVNKDGTHYAIKAGSIGKNEILFATTVAVKYPDQFMTLYDHAKNTLVYSKIDLTLKEYIQDHNFHPSQTILYDLYIQIFSIISILQKEGWTHHDLHIGNIGLIHTPNKTIEINGHAIPTHGYLVQAIDYGSVVHSIIPYRDIYRLFAGYVYNTETKTIIDVYSIKKKPLSAIQIKSIQRYLIKGTSREDQWKNNDLSFLLFRLLYPIEFKKAYPTIELLIFLPKKITLYIIKNINNPTKCLEYLITNK